MPVRVADLETSRQGQSDYEREDSGHEERDERCFRWEASC